MTTAGHVEPITCIRNSDSRSLLNPSPVSRRPHILRRPLSRHRVLNLNIISSSAPRRPGLRNQEILFLATRQPQIKSRLQGEPFPPQFKSGRSEVDLNLQQRVLLMLVSEPMKRRVSSLFLVVNSRLAQLFFLSHIGSSPRAHYL